MDKITIFNKKRHNINRIRLLFVVLCLLCFSNELLHAQSSSNVFRINLIKKESCNPGYDGKLSITFPNGSTSDYQVTWTLPNGNTLHNQFITGLHSGVYTVEVRPTLCPDKVIFQGVKILPKEDECWIDVQIAVSTTNVPCGSTPTATLTSSASGGVPPYNYDWQIKTVSSSGTYYCNVTDSLGNEGIGMVEVYLKKIECAQDPNEIDGPEGYGNDKMVAVSEKMNYTIHFENDPDFATAPASLVTISYPIPTNHNISSFRLGNFGFGDFIFTVPSNATSYNQRLDVSDSLGVWVDVTAGIDIVQQKAFWILQSIDPATGFEPASSQMGFLPVNNVETGNGEGFVSFYIYGNSNLATGDTVSADASIVFDENAPIGTNVWKNEFDAVAPSSHCDTISVNESDLICNLDFTYADDPGGSGVKEIELFVSVNNGTYASAGVYNPDSAVTYNYIAGNTYRFVSVASDNVGNKETFATTPDFILNENEAPTNIWLSPAFFYENAIASTVIGTFTTIDNDISLPFTYQLVPSPEENSFDNQYFTINNNQLVTNSNFNCDGRELYTVHVRSSDFGGLFYEKNFDISKIITNQNYVTPIYETICQGDTFPFGGDLLTTAGIYYDSLTTVMGCDSVIELTLTVNPSYNFYVSEVICDDDLPFTFSNTTFPVGTVSGTYPIILQTANYCDSIINLNLTVNERTTTSISSAICHGQVYNDFGFVADSGGVYTQHLQRVNGCDSTVILNLTEYPVYRHYDSVTICDNDLPYSYGSQTFPVGTATGDYNVVLRTVDYCDSIIQLHLTVNPTFIDTTNIAICDNELPYTYATTTFSIGTISAYYPIMFHTVNNCDSLIVLNLSVNPTYNHIDTEVICDNNLPYVYGDTIFPVGTVSGVYPIMFTSIHNCDSLVNLTLTVNPTYNHIDALTICDNQLPYTYGHYIFPVGTSTGQYPIHFQSVNSCDSLVTLTLTVNPTYNHTVAITICDNELPYTFASTTFPIGTLSGQHLFHYSSANNCDSTVTLNLSVNPTYNHVDVRSICMSELPYNYGDTIFPVGTLSGVYPIMFSSIHNCDSLVNLTLTVNPTYNHVDALTICDNQLPYTYGPRIFPVGTISDQYPVHFQSVNNCDSLVTLTLTVNPTYHHSVAVTICDNELPYTYASTVFPIGTTSGQYPIHFQSVHNCDSTVTLNLTVNPTYNHFDARSICISELPYIYGDTIFPLGTVSGVYPIMFSSIYNCDSLVNLTLTVYPTYNHVDNLTICENQLPYTYGPRIFPVGTTSGQYPIHFQSVNGCDSLVTLTLTVNPTYHHSVSVTICDNELPYIYATTSFPVGTISGQYPIHFQSVNNCDSIITLHLTVNPTYHHYDARTICDNELPYTYATTTFPVGTVSGQYPILFQSINNCDSLVTLTLTVNPTYNHNDAVAICDNQLPYTYGPIIFPVGTTSDQYPIHFQSVNNCDSLINLNLTVNPTYYFHNNYEMCDNGSYQWQDTTLTGLTAGTYTFYNNLHSDNGCDSIYELTLKVHPTYHYTSAHEICDNESYQWRDTLLTDLTAGDYTYFDNLQSINGCDSIYQLNLTVNPTYIHNDAVVICGNEFPYTYGDSVFNQTGVYQVMFTTINNCDSLINLTLSANPTNLILISDTICQGDGYLLYGFNLPSDSTLIPGNFQYHLDTVNQYGCDSTVLLTLTINRNVGSIGTISGTTLITEANDYFYSIDPVDYATAYQWNISNSSWTLTSNNTNATLTVSVGGNGTLSVVASNNCGVTPAATLNIQSNISITSYDNIEGMKVYPNPTKDNIELLIENSSVNVTEIGLFDLYGKLLKIVKVNGQITPVTLGEYANGVYFLRVMNSNSVLGTFKVIKN